MEALIRGKAEVYSKHYFFQAVKEAYRWESSHVL